MKYGLSLLFSFLCLISQAQDPFSNLSARSRIQPDQLVVNENDIKFRITLEGRENNFALLKSNMFEFVYDSNNPMGHIKAINFTDTAAMFRVGTIYVRGKYDAKRSYKMYTPSAVTTLVLTAIPVAGPVLGVAFAVPASLTTPKIEYLGHPNIPLVEDRIYYQGYAEEARRIKARRIWLNFGIGFGICLGTLFLNETLDNNFLGFRIFNSR